MPPIINAKLITSLLCLSWTLGAQISSAHGSALSLIVNLSNELSIEKTLSQLCEVANNKNVAVGEIIILGYQEQSRKEYNYFRAKYEIPNTVNLALEGKEFLKQFRRTGKAAQYADSRAQLGDPDKESLVETALTTRLLAKYSLEPIGNVQITEALTHFGITSLPAWIVSDGDKDYVFQQSIASPSRLFSARGEFINALNLRAPGQTARRYIFEELDYQVVNQTFGKPTKAILNLSPSGNERVFSFDCRNFSRSNSRTDSEDFPSRSPD